MKKFLMLVWGLILGFSGAARAAPDEGFEDQTILGWQVKVSVTLQRARPLVAQQAVALLRQELEAVTRAVPSQRLPQLRKAVFWLDERVAEGEAQTKAPVFHPDRSWLRAHGLNPNMAGGIELPNAQTFLDSYSWEPWAILHELAHFYQNAVLGDGNADIRRAYQHARDTQLYEKVAHYDGKTLRAYALENEREYFAELTEAYFGRNDFYPFTRGELAAYDPAGFAVIRALWEGR